jgi:hypothetical protein
MQTTRKPSRVARNLEARISKHEAMIEALQRKSMNAAAAVHQLRQERFALAFIKMCRAQSTSIGG